MKKSTRRQTKVPLLTAVLDIDEFNSLTDLLFELMKENHSKCARLLGISRHTWKKWETDPPTWPWWNLVLRVLIKQYITALRGRKGLTQSHRQRVMETLHKIPNSLEFMEEIDTEAYQLAASSDHLRRLLTPGGMWFDDIIKPANSGGFSEQTLRRAARSIGVVKTQEGFGKKKRMRWRLPDQDDD